jgi:nicotinamide riboside transporter PnuC
MTPFEYFFVTCYFITCIGIYLWEKKVKKKLKKHYRKKLNKKLKKIKKRRQLLHIDGDDNV